MSPCSFNRMVQGEAYLPTRYLPSLNKNLVPTEQSWCLGVVGRLNPHLFWDWRGGTAPGFCCLPRTCIPMGPFCTISFRSNKHQSSFQNAPVTPEMAAGVRP